jgi:hypothetical protein
MRSCRTSGRKEKEKAIRNRFSNSMEAALKGLEKAIVKVRAERPQQDGAAAGQDSGAASVICQRSLRRGAEGQALKDMAVGVRLL